MLGSVWDWSGLLGDEGALSLGLSPQGEPAFFHCSHQKKAR
jgi:hypothetical protein